MSISCVPYVFIDFQNMFIHFHIVIFIVFFIVLL